MPSKPTLEILISTMNRVNFDFVEAMFPHHKMDELQLLIINQTNQEKLLISDQKSIRVVNTNEFGLSKSRNLAIKNAIGKLVLIADDDIIYLPDFDKTIHQAHQKYPNAALISFQFLNSQNQLAKKYINKERAITSPHQNPLSSVEISLKLDTIRKNNIYFDENFGLGAVFPAHEEQLLLHKILSQKLEVIFYPKPILIHKSETTAANPSNIDYVRSLAAQKFLIYGNFTYFWLIKYIFYLIRKGFINFKSTFTYYTLGYKAIKKIQKLNSEVRA